MVPKSAVDATAGLLLVNAEVSGTPMQAFLALTTNEAEKWWKLPGVYYFKDWKVDAHVGGKWSVSVEIKGGKVVHEWGEFCKMDAPNIFIKPRKWMRILLVENVRQPLVFALTLPRLELWLLFGKKAS
jgi:hypothetical protein